MRKLYARFFLLLFFVIFHANSTFSQEKPTTFELKGKLSSGQDAHLDEVIVHLLQASDKKLVKMEYPDKQGNFTFDKIPPGTYILVTQSMGFVKYQSDAIIHNKNTNVGTITLQASSTTLKEAAVVATKPFIQQQYDKTVLNVASSISAVGSTALEVLEKAPGITIDQNDNIAMRGRQGVLVMIDGKLVPMNGQELANLLRSMSANQIEKIDLITNPSSRYDAAGNAGIIDIRLRKGQQKGTNGNVTLSYGQGVYYKFNPSININSKIRKVNLFASYSYSDRLERTKLQILRDFYNEANKITGSNNYDNYFKYYNKNHNARIGADYNINSNIVIGVVANGIFNDGKVRSNSAAKTFNAASQQTGSFVTGGSNNTNRDNGSINLNYRHKLDSSGKELSADFDYARYASDELQNYTTDFFDLFHHPSQKPYVLVGNLNGDLRIKSFKIDYAQPIKPIDVQIEAGVKSSWVTADNDVKFYDRSDGKNELDLGKSNHFIYEENINAAYLNATKKWRKLTVQAGLRVENTIAKGNQLTNNDQFDRNYTQLFPSGFIGYEFNQRHDLGFSLSRRIDRPSYRQLNPFTMFLDPFTYSTGNPYLNPEITNSFELVHTFQQKYITKIGFSKTTDNILTVLSPDVKPNTIIQTGRNLAEFLYYNASVDVPITIGHWLTSNNTALVFYSKYNGNLVNTDLNVGRTTFNFSSNNSITIDPKTSLEIIGSYTSRSYYGFLDVGSIWFVNIGAQRQILHKKASIKINCSDIFFTNKTNAITRLTGYGEHFFQQRDTRVITVSFNYKFGGQSNGSKRKTGSADDEKKRAGG
ncbi:TonB-dependent receptor domain-containing protein [Chitinophaga nivalis]|uniref:TonB-dependent receptor n=1 Tax=Chitinophaga nivalis TaxID=2991709 RepID=A0ABT3IK34_9BACT|nr:TonB-dependent receptor [Chitinophaga nivalis]MCW3466000.1 TonB-dependent receptor [Chitinophaga nivalis]MCW3484309.1 TonB-dependent receptor [Chitinophaga nivalis]